MTESKEIQKQVDKLALFLSAVFQTPSEGGGVSKNGLQNEQVCAPDGNDYIGKMSNITLSLSGLV